MGMRKLMIILQIQETHLCYATNDNQQATIELLKEEC